MDISPASFRPDDPDVLVAASLSCPCCLSATTWTPGPDVDDPTVLTSCPQCGHRCEVALDPQQALRLALLPA